LDEFAKRDVSEDELCDVGSESLEGFGLEVEFEISVPEAAIVTLKIQTPTRSKNRVATLTKS
jgi:hypothetical protein